MPDEDASNLYGEEEQHAYPSAVGDYICDLRPGMPGGYGIVFRATHVDAEIKDVFAVKFLRADCAKVPSIRRRFIEEGNLLRRLDHENCIRIRDAGEQDGIPYIVMDFIEGQNTREMAQGGGLPSLMAARIVTQAARGLEHAHALAPPLIHRDIKPSNILFDAVKQRAIVSDFGLAKCLYDWADTRPRSTEPLTPFGETTLGTVHYTPPEYFKPEGHQDVVGPRGDIFSLGATFYELLAGRPPFPVNGKLDEFQAKSDIMNRIPPRPLPLNVPEGIRRICEKAMHFERDERHLSSGELATALETAIHQIELRQAERSTLPQSPPRKTRSVRAIAFRKGSAVIGLMLIVVMVLMTVSSRLDVRRNSGQSPFTKPSDPPPPSTQPHVPTPPDPEDPTAEAIALERQAADAYSKAAHPDDGIEVRFDHATELFDKMCTLAPRYVRGRITYLNCLQDFCMYGPSKRTPRAVQTALTVLRELNRLRLDENDRSEISVYRSYFSVYQEDVPQAR